MRPGEAFNDAQRHDIRRAIEQAQRGTGLHFSVLVGDSSEDHRAYAKSRHAMLPEPDRSVFLLVDPGAHVLEIVTGSEARRVLSDADVALGALGMRTSFSGGDLAGGIVHGIQQLADHARVPKTLHTRTPLAPPAP